MTKLERPIPQIIHHEDRFSHSSALTAFIRNRHVGTIEYYRNYEAGRWEIENVIVNDDSKGRGVGQALLRSFVDQVGPDQTVRGAIIHEGTYQTLVERYGIGSSGEITHVPLEDFPSIALVRGLKLCGIEITKISVGVNPPETEDIPYNIEFQGKTL